MSVLAWVAGLAAGVLLLDRLALWAERHGWLYWRKRTPEVNGGATVAMFGELQTLLSPSNRHVVEEQRSREMIVVVAGSEETAPDEASDPGANTAVVDWDHAQARDVEGDDSRDPDGDAGNPTQP